MKNDDDSGPKGPKDAEERAADGAEAPGDLAEDIALVKGGLTRILENIANSGHVLQRGYEHLLRSMANQLSELGRQNNKLAREQFEVLDLQQAMMDRQTERELAVREQAAKETRKRELFEKLSVLFPILLQKVMGTSDRSGALFDEMLCGLVESLQQEQIEAIASHLDDAQKVAFMRLYLMARDRGKPSDKDATPTKQPAAAPSETDAGGVHAILRALLAAFGDKVTLDKAHAVADGLPDGERDAFLKAYAEKVDAAGPTSKRFEAIFAVFGHEFVDREFVTRFIKLLPEELQEQFIAALRDFQKKRAA